MRFASDHLSVSFQVRVLLRLNPALLCVVKFEQVNPFSHLLVLLRSGWLNGGEFVLDSLFVKLRLILGYSPLRVVVVRVFS